MSETISLPRSGMSRRAALGWLAALGLLFVAALALPLALRHEQAALFVQIHYHGVSNYPVVPAVPFPAPPTGDLETIEIDGLRIAVPEGSIDHMEIDPRRNGLLRVHLQDGLVVAIDRPVRPVPVQLSDTRAGELDVALEIYSASPEEFSWSATDDDTRRLGQALAMKKNWLLIESATGVSNVKRPTWEGYAVRSPSTHALNWLTPDEAWCSMLWIEKPPGVETLSDVVFGSFEVVRPPSGTYDEDAKRLTEKYPPPKAGE